LAVLTGSALAQDAAPTPLNLDADLAIAAEEGDATAQFARRGGDNFDSPQQAEQLARREQALKERLAGKGSGKIHRISNGQYVELGLERNDRVFVLLVEHGNLAGFTTPVNQLPATAGPLHNAIAQPDRNTDNSSIWQADYSSDHFRDMYFRRMVDFYQTQSSGRYTINGAVTEWVRVPFNGPRYGSNLMGDAGAWTLIADGINTWVASEMASGKSMDEVKAYLKTFDNWDRYDYDHDGNFDESDGYIDHFQIVHSGAGEEVGGGAQGTNAIWSHRWFAFYNWAGFAGPSYNLDGGIEFGGGWGANPTRETFQSANAYVAGMFGMPSNSANSPNAHPVNSTGIFVGDYTIQPENGGLGVFAHEYGHDLGLPDHYDTTNQASNSSGFWTIMSSGSYLGDGTTDLGSTPGDFNAWDKLQLGWLNYELATAGQFSTHRLGPAETNTKQAQAVVVALPPSQNVFYMFDPAAGKLPFGNNAWWSTRGDKIDTSMVRSLAVPTPVAPATTVSMTMRLWYEIEANWDYGYVSVSSDNGTTWTNLSAAGVTTTTNPNGTNLGNGITGSTSNAFRLATFNLTPYAGTTVLLRVRYKTDEFTSLRGLQVDELIVGGVAVDGAEAGLNGWTLNGFKSTNGIESSNMAHYYLAEFRQYRTYDKGLKTGPYTFGTEIMRNWVTHYPYQDGLLVTYWDTDQSNNNVFTHRGEGRILPVDAHPEPLMRTFDYPQGPVLSAWSTTIQSFDSTFGLEPTDSVTLPFFGRFNATSPFMQFSATLPSLPAVPVFNDLNSWWSPVTPFASVIVPKTGTTIRVVSTSAQNSFMQIQVAPVK
jgi:immune inhibitor A